MVLLKGLGRIAVVAAALYAGAAFAQQGGVTGVKILGFEDGEQAKARWVLDDWEENKPGKSTAERVSEHATEGRKALKVTFRPAGGALVLEGLPRDWSAYDTLEIDCFSASDKVEHLNGWVRDDAAEKSGDYWDRHNYEKNLVPGKSIISFPVGGLFRGEKGSGKFIDTKAIVSMNLVMNGVTVYLDNVRLVKGAKETEVKGLRKFDFGPDTSPNFPGFTAVLPDSSYTRQRGFGWVGGNPSDARYYEQPDALIGDFIRVTDGQQFAVDVPNGEYSVSVNLDSPGFWDYMYFSKRAIEVEGAQVFSQDLPAKEFLKDWYFRFENEEDLPGKDIWKTYVGDRFVPKTFKVKVNDGQLNLKFTGDTWGLTISYIVLYSAADADAGAKWTAELNARRKASFVESYAEEPTKAEPKPTLSAAETAAGYALFSRGLEKDVTYNSAPGAGDARDLKIDWASCPGECAAYSFCIYPTKNCGDLTLKISDLKGPAGAGIPASAFEQRVIRYKFKRVGTRVFSTYNYRPDLLVPFEKWAVPADVTRRIWLTLHVPPDAKAGKYAGTVDIQLAGRTTTVPVALEVYPFTLDEPTMSIGMYGGSGPSGGSYWPDDVLREFRYWDRVEEVIADQKAHGMTALTPMKPQLKGIENGKAVFDTTKVDRFMDLLRKHGYTHECFTYAEMFNVSDEAPAAEQYGMSLERAIKLTYEELGRHVAEKKWPVKMAWALADEPLIHGVSADVVVKVFKAHRAAAPQMQFVIEDANPGEEEIIKACDIICANSPRYSVAKAIKENKGRYWFNNIGTDRLTFGWFLWKAKEEMGVEALFQWGYSTNNADVFYDFDGSEDDSGCSVTTSRGQMAKATWERIRDGAQDHAYLQTLQNLIDKAGKGGTPEKKAEAAKAREFMKGVMAKINLERKRDQVFTSADLDAIKRKVAAHIIALR